MMALRETSMWREFFLYLKCFRSLPPFRLADDRQYTTLVYVLVVFAMDSFNRTRLPTTADAESYSCVGFSFSSPCPNIQDDIMVLS